MTPKWIRLALPALIALTMSFGVASVAMADEHPIAEDDPNVTTLEDVAVIIDVLDNDTEGDSGVESFTEPANGSVELNEDGRLTYTPDADFNGADSFEYTLEDDENGDGTATVVVTVEAVGDAPVAVDDSTSTDASTPVEIDVLANDSDADEPDGEIDATAVTVTLVVSAANGEATVDGDTQEVTYTPDAGFTGLDSFTYVIEHDGDTSNEAIVTVFVGSHADLSIVKDVVLGDGDAATFVITVSNAGPDAATDVVVSDTLPGGVTYLSDDGGGSYDAETRVWTWTVAELAVDASVTIRIEVTVDDPEAEVTSTVTVTSDVPDANSDNDLDSLTLNPSDGPDYKTCTGAEHPAFASICEMMQGDDISPAVYSVLKNLLHKMAGKTASGWYRNHGGGEDSKLAAFCARKPEHKRCLEPLEPLDADGDEEDEGKGKSSGGDDDGDDGDDEGDDD